MLSEGARRLGVEMAARGWSRQDAAKALGVDVSVVRRWVNGQRRPDLDLAVRIEAVLGIPARAWSNFSQPPQAA